MEDEKGEYVEFEYCVTFKLKANSFVNGTLLKDKEAFDRITAVLNTLDPTNQEHIGQILVGENAKLTLLDHTLTYARSEVNSALNEYTPSEFSQISNELNIKIEVML